MAREGETEREVATKREIRKERECNTGRGFWQRHSVRKTLTMKNKTLPTTLETFACVRKNNGKHCQKQVKKMSAKSVHIKV